MGNTGEKGQTPDSLSGSVLLMILRAATEWLKQNAEAINAANVFPVPDGDTGTNMYLTMRAAMNEAREAGSDDADVVARAIAHGALMGARGNSGVILSQILDGFAQSLSGKARFNSLDFAEALEQGAATAQQAVSKPVEGTILTVIRELAGAARSHAERSRNLRRVLRSAVKAAEKAVADTPNKLPVLREAGVVDAGGQGLYVILEGAWRYLRGDKATPGSLAVQSPKQSWFEETARVHKDGESGYGHCTEFLIIGTGLDAQSVLQQLVTLGESVLVVGDEKVLRVHLHTDDPGSAFKYGESLGKLDQCKVDDIEAQAGRFACTVPVNRGVSLAPIGIVAVTSGSGLRVVFGGLGVTAIVPGGSTMNPSTEQICAAIDSCHGQDKGIVLPNNKNVIMTARQAARHSDKNVKIVSTESMPQGIAALLAFDPEAGLDENLNAMKEARSRVVTIEVKEAIRSATSGRLPVLKGQAVGFLDGEMVAAEDSTDTAVLSCLDMVKTSGGLVTLYYGTSVNAEEAQALAAKIKGVETEVLFGGQSYYYIVSVE